ncbi:MAG TPA: hypothetical protein VLF40_00165 [Candidatus Saccharimonadales bacterium]|nr:hypothetical protein [Candidatus Saccharimonadales bacterium]
MKTIYLEPDMVSSSVQPKYAVDINPEALVRTFTEFGAHGGDVGVERRYEPSYPSIAAVNFSPQAHTLRVRPDVLVADAQDWQEREELAGGKRRPLEHYVSALVVGGVSEASDYLALGAQGIAAAERRAANRHAGKVVLGGMGLAAAPLLAAGAFFGAEKATDETSLGTVAVGLLAVASLELIAVGPRVGRSVRRRIDAWNDVHTSGWQVQRRALGRMAAHLDALDSGKTQPVVPSVRRYTDT